MSQEAKCNADSLPLCLRHYNQWETLEQAGFLAEFLQAAAENTFRGGLCPSESELRGMSLCFDLLRDKLSIANDELDWPTSEYNGKNVLKAVGPNAARLTDIFGDDKEDDHV